VKALETVDMATLTSTTSSTGIAVRDVVYAVRFYKASLLRVDVPACTVAYSVKSYVGFSCISLDNHLICWSA
jgi:hypothetical protein